MDRNPQQGLRPSSACPKFHLQPAGEKVALTGQTRGSETLLQKYCHGDAL